MYRRLTGLRKRHCPKCDAEMEERRINPNVRVDVCPECSGLWFDHGELKELTGGRFSERADPRTLGEADRTEYVCPDCDRDLFQRDFMEKSGIQIDQCIHCAGIFLDAGELEQVIDFLRSYGTEIKDFQEWEKALQEE